MSYLFGDFNMLIPHVRPPSSIPCAWGLMTCFDASETGSSSAVAEALQLDYRLVPACPAVAIVKTKVTCSRVPRP